jgi:predicted NBD/HSP70 family sugar kinase
MSDERALGLRHMNRLRVLETLYRHPGSSRADLTRHTGLSRPTVSALVEEMVRAGVVQEQNPADCPASAGEPGPPEADRGRRASGRPVSEMETRLGIGVELENDANVGALGEKAFGAAHDVDDFV